MGVSGKKGWGNDKDEEKVMKGDVRGLGSARVSRGTETFQYFASLVELHSIEQELDASGSQVRLGWIRTFRRIVRRFKLRLSGSTYL